MFLRYYSSFSFKFHLVIFLCILENLKVSFVLMDYASLMAFDGLSASQKEEIVAVLTGITFFILIVIILW